MIIIRTPLRISFFGGGTDHPTWYKAGGKGAVLSTSIDKFVYLTLRDLPKMFDFNCRIVWRILEQTKTVDELQHPVVRSVFSNYRTKDEDLGFELVYHADLPARSGLGSSSAFTVAALHALWMQEGQEFNKERLAQEAIKVEQVFLNEPVGSQDQVAVAYGGLNRIDFRESGRIDVEPVDVSPKRRQALEDHMMLVFTRFTRDAGAVEKQKIANFVDRSAQLNRMYDMVGEGVGILENPMLPITDFGELLNEAWLNKKQLADGVSTGPIDAIYKAALEAGAIGGKLLGAGGGGFLLFFVPPQKRAAVAAALAEVTLEQGHHPIVVPVKMETKGSSVVLFEPGYNMMLEY